MNRLRWDMRFDPAPKQLKQSLTQMQQMMSRILQRPEVEEKARKTDAFHIYTPDVFHLVLGMFVKQKKAVILNFL